MMEHSPSACGQLVVSTHIQIHFNGLKVEKRQTDRLRERDRELHSNYDSTEKASEICANERLQFTNKHSLAKVKVGQTETAMRRGKLQSTRATSKPRAKL